MRASLNTRVWSEEEFANARDTWDGLVQRSNADPLFMCWDWQWRWWKHFKAPLRASLEVLGVYDADGALVGLAPFYMRWTRTRGVIPTRRLEIVGVAWRQAGVAFSEYLDFIVANEHAPAVRQRIGEWMASRSRWHDMVIACARSDSHAAQVVSAVARPSWVLREVDRLVAQRVDVGVPFEAFLGRLSANTRRHLYLQRSRRGAGRFVSIPTQESDAYLDRLQEFRKARWGSDTRSSESGRFDRDIAGWLGRQRQLRLTALLEDDRALSIMCNARVGATEYYLQSGFDSALRGVSPGYLHMGYAIESACSEGVKWFDLLGGLGRKGDYKRKLVTEKTSLACYHVVRAPWLCALYRLRAAAGSPGA